MGAGAASGALSPSHRDAVLEVLGRAQALGFLGPAPLEPQIEHALRFAAATGDALPHGPTAALDLGSGAGLPGLVLAMHWPASRWVLLESMARRSAVLEEAIEALGISDRVAVECRRAEAAAHDPLLRGRFDLVTARSFGPPAVVAECGGGFLRPDGLLVVSDPPTGPGDRWPPGELALLDLAVDHHEHGCTVLRCTGPLSPELPRRVGLPAKRPRF